MSYVDTTLKPAANFPKDLTGVEGLEAEVNEVRGWALEALAEGYGEIAKLTDANARALQLLKKHAAEGASLEHLKTILDRAKEFVDRAEERQEDLQPINNIAKELDDLREIAIYTEGVAQNEIPKLRLESGVRSKVGTWMTSVGCVGVVAGIASLTTNTILPATGGIVVGSVSLLILGAGTSLSEAARRGYIEEGRRLQEIDTNQVQVRGFLDTGEY